MKKMNIKAFFHCINYFQYPLGILALYFVFSPYISGFEMNEEKINVIFKSINSMMIFLGLAISFSTFQDSNKTSLNFEKKPETSISSVE